MRPPLAVAAAVALALAVSPVRAAPPQPPVDEDLEQKLVSELELRDPKGAEVFAQATAARKRGDLDRMAALLGQVHEHDPWFLPATRRLCFVESARAHHPLAVSLCQEAYDGDPSPVDAAALSSALLAGDEGHPDYDARALGLARESVDKAPDDYYGELALCQVALRLNDVPSVDRCSTAMRRIAPKDSTALFFASLDDAAHGRVDQARSEIEQAHASGLADPMYAAALRAIVRSTPPLRRWAPPAARGLGVWAAAFAAIVGLAGALGLIAKGTALRSGLRRLYRAALGAACAYYYASVWLAVLAVAGAGAFLVDVTVVRGELPVKILASGGVVVVASLAAFVASLRGGSAATAPGARIALGDNPALGEAIGEATDAAGVRRIDAVYLTEGDVIEILDRGGSLLAPPWRRGERCLVLGGGLLEGSTVGQIKDRLGGEAARIRDAERTGAGLTDVVRRSLARLSSRMIEGAGLANVLSPAAWIVMGFARAFALVSGGTAMPQPSAPVREKVEEDPRGGWSLIAKRPRSSSAGQV